MTAVELFTEIDRRPDAQSVLLLNSLGSTLAMWDPQLPELRAQFRVIRCDTRGHGRSPVPPGPYSIDDLVDDVVALLDQLGLESAHIVGLSLGGMTALRLAAREPQRVDRLAVLCTSALLGPPQMWADRATLVREHGTVAIASTIVSRWLTPEHRAADPAYAGELEAMIAGISTDGYVASCAAIEHMDLRGELGSITAPTLAIAGALDDVTPPPHLAEIADGVVDGKLLVVDNAAHLANLDQPKLVGTALVEHLLGASHPDAED
jgi:3-oxoadipate enol-lactonase